MSWLGPGGGGADREQGFETVSSAGMAAHTVGEETFLVE